MNHWWRDRFLLSFKNENKKEKITSCVKLTTSSTFKLPVVSEQWKRRGGISIPLTCKKIVIKLKMIDWLIDFNNMLRRLGLFYD